jgi:hypothetical protein
MIPIRVLNETGLLKFRDYLMQLGTTPSLDPTTEWLTDPATSNAFSPEVQIDNRNFETRFQLAQYLYGFAPLREPAVRQNIGLWSWLSLLFFDQLCPKDNEGNRTPREVYSYILSRDYRHYYRHLLATGFFIYDVHREHARVVLFPAMNTHGDFVEQLASRMELITNRGLIEAVDMLYYDASGTGSPKRGATNRKKKGTLRRLIDILGQLDLTYDLYGMTASQLLDLLPNEFDRWGRREIVGRDTPVARSVSA